MGGKEEGRIREFVMMNFGDAVVEEGTSEQGEGAMIIKFNERYEAEEVRSQPPPPFVFSDFQMQFTLVVLGDTDCSLWGN